MSAPPVEESGSQPALWFASLGGVVAWGLHLAIGWFLEEVVACGEAATARGEILGLDVEIWILALTAALAVAALAAGLIGYRRWRRASADSGGRAGREALMGLAGMVGAVLFVPIILMGGLQVLTLHPCSP